jgi:STE24 endopeptidase
MALLVSAATTGMLYALWRPPSSADVAALPAMGLIIWAGCLVAAPTFNLFDQTINYRADDYALSLTRDPDGLCQWLVATAAQDKPDPAPLESLLFYDHPPLKARLINAMRWKAAHGG